MNKFFECKISHVTTDPDTGKDKKMVDTYLVDALSFTEAEARVQEEVEAYGSSYGVPTIEGIKKTRLSDIFGEDIDALKWYKCKVSLIEVDEVSAKEKKVNCTYLVHADSLEDSVGNLKDAMKDSMSDYEVTSIVETPIMDILRYKVD